jgi:serine/threonine-protein kinase
MHFNANEIFEFNETFNENIIFASDPSAGTIVESLDGSPINISLYISKGLQTYDMPDLIGLTKEKATNLVTGAGLSSPEVIYEFNTEQPVDRIFAQNPPPLSKVNKTTPVTIYVSKGENPEGTIPPVIGMTEESAVLTLGNAGFKNISVVVEENMEEIGLVFSQIPESGTVYEKTLEIVIKISKGIEVPEVTGMKMKNAATLLEGLGFAVNILPDGTAAGNVIEQTPEKNTYLNYGSTVTIEVDPGTDVTGPTETGSSSETTEG